MAGPTVPFGDKGSGLHGTRAEAMRRLKVGVGGLVAMLLVVAVASAITDRTRDTEDPDTMAPGTSETVQEPASDPLVDIGVAPELPGQPQVIVPDLPAEQIPPDLPESQSPAGAASAPAK